MFLFREFQTLDRENVCFLCVYSYLGNNAK